MITRGTASGATRFITATITIEAELRAAAFIATAPDITATGEGTVPAAMQNPAVRAASARAPSATTTMADRKGAFRHAEAPASAAAEGRVAEAVADIDNRSFVRFLVHREI